LRYKLVTLPKGTTRIPQISFGTPGGISVIQSEGSVALNPTTNPAGNGNAGYTMLLADQRAGTITVTLGASGTGTSLFLGEEVTTTAQVVTGQEFKFTPNPNLTVDVSTTITVYGNETGGSQTIPVIVKYKA
jgi:hypothetical protein